MGGSFTVVAGGSPDGAHTLGLPVDPTGFDGWGARRPVSNTDPAIHHTGDVRSPR